CLPTSRPRWPTPQLVHSLNPSMRLRICMRPEEDAMRELTYAQAGLEAVAEEMRKDPTIFYMSTDPALSPMQQFLAKRFRPTPIAEGALTGIAIGAAGSGYRPIMDWRQATFSVVRMRQ